MRPWLGLACMLLCLDSTRAARATDEIFRAFQDSSGQRLLYVKGNATFYGDEKKLTQFQTGRFTQTPEAVRFSFSGAQGPAEFAFENNSGTLECGARKLKFHELARVDTRVIKNTAHFEPVPPPLKALLLGMIGGVTAQEFLLVVAPELPNRPPQPRLLVGKSRELKELRAYSNSSQSKIDLWGGDLRLAITPGAQGKGVSVQRRSRPLKYDYLAPSPDNLKGALGEKQYELLFGSSPRTPCDWISD